MFPDALFNYLSFIDNLLVRIQLIIVVIRWTGLAPWEFEFSLSGGQVPPTGRDDAPDVPRRPLQLDSCQLESPLCYLTGGFGAILRVDFVLW